MFGEAEDTPRSSLSRYLNNSYSLWNQVEPEAYQVPQLLSQVYRLFWYKQA